MRSLVLHPSVVWLILVAALSSVSCSRDGHATPQKHIVLAPAAAAPCVPTRVLVLPDKTLSTDQNETPIPLLSEVQVPVEKLLVRCGGEVLIGVVREHSNRRLKRLSVSGPPAEPPMPSQNENPLILKTQIMPKYHADMRAYQAARAAWERETRARFQVYFDEVRQLLEQKPFAMRSDVFGAVNRGDAALAEPDAAFGGACHEYFILVSDGIDNVHKERPVMRSRAKLLLVNGTGTSGSLDGLVSDNFESLSAAIQHVLALEGVR